MDRDTILQKVTDTATTLTHAVWGASFSNVPRAPSGDSYLLSALSGMPKQVFTAAFPQPRAAAVFGRTFRGERTVRLDDVTQAPPDGQHAPYAGMPAGHPSVRSYLAVPVKGVHGDVLGGLSFWPLPGAIA